ncbi:MAG: EscU/YscU/HrcU family type III secretion system export apparatus switch protein [Alphaproteobacteria bacterium]|nr:EscU/YscU/HrcU family type III secretion system export apparatus switch protein [Alphaproteobacteria bacterium]
MADDPEQRAAAKRAIAVALRWEPDQDESPRVVASGHGAVAERILEIAFANDIKVREDPDLAQILAAVDVDAFIPVEAFMAVAEILAHLYRVNASLTGEARASRP